MAAPADREERARPSARKASLGVPCSTMAAAMAQAPATSPTVSAVPVLFAVARRHAAGWALLYLTTSGSVARPREALRAKA